MALNSLGLFAIEEASSSKPAKPQTAVIKESAAGDPEPFASAHELDALEWGARLNGPLSMPKDGSMTMDEQDIERSSPPTPITSQHVEVVPSLNSPSRNKWRFAASAITFLTAGMNDSTPGALLPYMEKDYSIGYAVVSCIFVANAIGFISAAPLVQVLEHKLGRARTQMLSSALMLLGYTVVATHPPFALVAISFAILGFGIALMLSMNNSFFVNLVNGTFLLGILHGCYGIGGVIAPLIATAMVSQGMRWSYFYCILVAISVINLATTGYAYQDFEADSPSLLTALERTVSRRENGTPSRKQSNSFASAMKSKTTLLGALFIFAYQGAEVSISGWVISFLIQYRDGDPAKVGNVTSGFWGGITLGRFLLSSLTHKIGEKRAVVGLVIGSSAFQLLVWLVPNVIGNAIAVAVLGIMLGPVYPAATFIFSRLLPKRLHMNSLSIIASMGSSGGAVAPFFTGVIAQKAGTFVLNPICIGLFVVMEIAWLLLPKISRRQD